MNLYARRRLTSRIALGFSMTAAAFGLFWLVAILWTLFYNGLTALGADIFTLSTPPPGIAGGLLNALYGSVVMTLLATLIGTPIGIMAGGYLGGRLPGETPGGRNRF